MSKAGFVLRDPLGKMPDQPVPESLSLRARLSDGTVLDLVLHRDGQALEIRMVPGSTQIIGYSDLAVLPIVSNVVRIKAIDTHIEKGARVS